MAIYCITYYTVGNTIVAYCIQILLNYTREFKNKTWDCSVFK